MAQTDTLKTGAQLGFEADLFKAADKLRGNMEPSDYKHVALGLIFLKYISDAFEAKHKALLAEEAQAAEDKDCFTVLVMVFLWRSPCYSESATDRSRISDICLLNWTFPFVSIVYPNAL
jgi:type I restriction-modification system DNA methylase subunit